jgi:hypothetical protein
MPEGICSTGAPEVAVPKPLPGRLIVDAQLRSPIL